MRRPLALLLALGAFGAGCGSGDEEPRGPQGADAVGAPAVQLRAELAETLGARAWLTAFAARTALISGAGSPQALAARGTLDTASVALGKRLGRVSGEAGRATALLRQEDELWGELAAALAVGDADARETAEDGLAMTRRTLASLLVEPGLAPKAATDALARAARSLSSAIAAVAAGAELAPARTQTAATRASRLAPALAKAARRGGGDGAGSPAAELSELAATTLTDHTYAQAAADAVVAASARRGPRLRAALEVVAGSTDTLGQLVTSVHGEDAGERFAAAWELHVEALVSYTEAKATDDAAGARAALGELDAFRAEVTTLLDEVDPDGDGRPLARALRAHVDTQTAVVRAQVADSPKVGTRLLDAAGASQGLGRVMVRRFAVQYPKTFPAL